MHVCRAGVLKKSSCATCSPLCTQLIICMQFMLRNPCLAPLACLQYLNNEQLLIHDLVSCWWVVLKHCSVRTAVPNR